MSKAPEPLYNVTLKHLSREGTKAAANLPAEQLNHITAKQLRGVIEAVGALGPGVVFPVEPELRITTPEGMFVVQAKAGKLNLVSWSSRHKGGEYSAQRIFSIVTGQEIIETAQREVAAAGGGWLQGKAALIGLVVAIVAVNAFTLWFVMRPKKTLLPKYTLLAPEPAGRLIANVAGVYETGGTAGDRRIEIEKSGQVQRYKFGAERALTDKQTFVVQGAEAAGKPALLTSRRTLITVADSLTVVLYGDRYRRVPR